jgi:hypothetical protein
MIARNNQLLYLVGMSETGRREWEGRNFKRDASGRLIYFPSGTASAGRLVPQDCERSVKSAVMAVETGSMFALTLYLAVYGFGSTDFTFLILAPSVFPHVIGAGMSRVTASLSAEEAACVIPLKQLLIETFVWIALSVVVGIRIAMASGPIAEISGPIAIIVVIGMLALLVRFYWRPYRSHLTT